MPLWGTTDTANDAPNFVPAAQANNIYFVDTTEAAVTANRAKGLKTPGWNLYSTYVDSDGNTRHRVETLVAMGVAAGDAGDIGARDPISANSIVANTTYVIVTAGNSDFTTIGAANNDVGTVFTANNTGSGTGTVRIDEDTVVADS